MEYFLDVIQNHYADFEGRARRSEYWYYNLFLSLLGFGTLALAGAMMLILPGRIGMVLFILSYFVLVFGTIVPSLAVTIRRLHDTGKSGWWLLISLIPFGSIVLLVFLLTDSTPGPNSYGENPKEFNDTLELGHASKSLSHHLIEDDDDMTV